MRPITFDYSFSESRAPAPIIPIQIKRKYGWVKIWGYVDSGASFSIFRMVDARRLIRFKKNPKP